MQFLFGFGLFSDVWAPIAEIIINLSVAIIGGSLWGLKGVLLGGIISQLLIVGIWKPYFLFSRGFRIKVWPYWINIAKYIGAIIISWNILQFCIINNITISPTRSYASWILYAIIIITLYFIICFTLMYSLNKGMRDFTYRILKIKK